jgi:hypothetical protein
MGGVSLSTLLLVAGALFLLTRFGERLATGRRATHARSEPPHVSGPPICPSCCRPLPAQGNFCPDCRTPLTGYASTGPIESIAAEGELFRRSSASPSAFVVAGLWLIALPFLIVVMLAVWEHNLRFGPESLGEVIVATLFVVIAVRATIRYRSRGRQHTTSGAEPPV